MKAEFVNPFLTPAIDVWKKELAIDLEFTRAESGSGSFTTEDITTIIGVTGKLKGNVFYEMDRATACSVAGAMCGVDMSDLDDLGLSAIGEMANMITDNATTLLSENGYICDIAPPVMLPRGAQMSISTPHIRAFFTSPLGELSIRISLAETTR